MESRNYLSMDGLAGDGFGCLLLSPDFQDFPVAVGVDVDGESRATSRPVFREEPAGFEANPTSVAEGFWAEGAGSPLRCLLNQAMATAPLL